MKKCHLDLSCDWLTYKGVGYAWNAPDKSKYPQKGADSAHYCFLRDIKQVKLTPTEMIFYSWCDDEWIIPHTRQTFNDWKYITEKFGYLMCGGSINEKR